jgi:stearoyl-CoA desaturase (delta-9 desaturase)
VTYYLLKIMSWFGLVWGLKPIPERVYTASIRTASKIKISSNKVEHGEGS